MALAVDLNRTRSYPIGIDHRLYRRSIGVFFLDEPPSCGAQAG
jgi:hypothetical protein